ncbi:hypothetical protein GCM10020331_044910 [Ectobacillus funiculus]
MGGVIMTNEILLINGNVKFSITLDPSVWIFFDDRKVDLCTYFNEPRLEQNQLEQYTKKALQSIGIVKFAKELRSLRFNAASQSLKRKNDYRDICNAAASIFLQNAEINEGAHAVEIHTETKVYTLTLQDAMEAILGFSKDGKPLREDGPVHLYFGDGSNVNNPIVQVRRFTVL